MTDSFLQTILLQEIVLQVESVLSQHPGVLDVVVVGIPDTWFTEMVIACIQLRKGWRWSNRSLGHSIVEEKQHASSDILRQHCIEKSLTAYSSSVNLCLKHACLGTKVHQILLSFCLLFVYGRLQV